MFQDGKYYWARHSDGTRFVVMREDGYWYCCGNYDPMQNFDDAQIICPIAEPNN